MARTESPRQTLRRFDMRPRKGLGQHFLVDQDAAAEIVAAALADEPDGIIEIGPGLGVLTRGLAASGLPVIAIEKDEAMREPLAELEEQYPNLTVRYEDVMRADLGEITGRGKYAAIGNLPYQITSPLLEMLFTTEPPPTAIVITVQREVGQRLAADPGTKEYGALTLLARLHAGKPEIVRDLAPGAFHPPPKVHSLAIRFVPQPDALGSSDKRKQFFRVVRASFRQRRKQIRNALANAGELGLDSGQARRALLACGVEPVRRGETLTVEEFIALADAIEQVKAGG
jgi:16S rRNA (adenine1518-N6/adenine1519-N6)-dimethyltransferase